LRRMAKQRTIKRVNRIAEIWMVENIKELSAKLKINVLCETKLSLQCSISLPGAETTQHIASEITLLPCGRLCESCLIQNLAARKLRAKKFKRHSHVYVRTGSKLCARSKKSGANHVNRRRSSGENETVQRPIAKYVFDEFLRSRRGKIVSESG